MPLLIPRPPIPPHAFRTAKPPTGSMMNSLFYRSPGVFERGQLAAEKSKVTSVFQNPVIALGALQSSAGMFGAYFRGERMLRLPGKSGCFMAFVGSICSVAGAERWHLPWERASFRSNSLPRAQDSQTRQIAALTWPSLLISCKLRGDTR